LFFHQAECSSYVFEAVTKIRKTQYILLKPTSFGTGPHMQVACQFGCNLQVLTKFQPSNLPSLKDQGSSLSQRHLRLHSVPAKMASHSVVMVCTRLTIRQTYHATITSVATAGTAGARSGYPATCFNNRYPGTRLIPKYPGSAQYLKEYRKKVRYSCVFSTSLKYCDLS